MEFKISIQLRSTHEVNERATYRTMEARLLGSGFTALEGMGELLMGVNNADEVIS